MHAYVIISLWILLTATSVALWVAHVPHKCLSAVAALPVSYYCYNPANASL